MLDQDYVLLRNMRAAHNVYRTLSKMRSLRGDAINTQLTVPERILLGRLQELGIL